MRSHLASAYPHIEFVLVDDRSSDGTAEIADRLAAADARVRVVHVSELPRGWLGKVHALHVGRGHARGDWVLFTDADTRVRPDTLRRLIPWCEAEGVDFLSPVVRLFASHPLLDVVVGAFARVLFTASRPWRSADPHAREAFGLGAFMLVRRAALDRSEGFAWLRLEVADDMALAMAVKRAGGRLNAVNASDFVEVPLYSSIADLRRSTEKGGYSIVGRYSAARTVAWSVLLPLLELSPLAGFVAGSPPAARVVGAAGLGMMIAAATATMVWTRRAAWTGLAYPLGLLWMSCLQIRSALVCGRKGGVEWRGTFYPAATLRAGIRVRWPR
jgi:glycosyltransferase involved in cell wall biosynthesis